MWYLQESNQGHKDFQSFALPTELRYQALVDCKITSFLILGKYKVIEFQFFAINVEFIKDCTFA